MSNTDNARQLLIRRYSRLSNVPIEKAVALFQNASIDEVIEKHEKKLTFSIVLIVLLAVALLFQFMTLYFHKDIPSSLITNVLLLVFFQKGLHDNYEIKEILKTIRAMGEK
ncbi:MAG: hypothetical protein ACM3P1_09620 [Candidatus Saccharibacteria bacterium]